MALDVLLIEDNPMNLELHRDLLEADGHRVTVCENAADFRAWLRNDGVPNIVLMDILLPDASGADLLVELMRDPRRAHVPVVAITAQALIGDVPRLERAGFTGVITKPIDTRTFTDTVVRFSGQKAP